MEGLHTYDIAIELESYSGQFVSDIADKVERAVSLLWLGAVDRMDVEQLSTGGED